MFDPKVEHCDIFFFFLQIHKYFVIHILSPASKQRAIDFFSSSSSSLHLFSPPYLPPRRVQQLAKQFLLFLANGFKRRQSKANFPFLSAALDGE